MEGFTYSSCGGSRDSSPRSRDIDDENQPWDESSAGNYKVKFICSFGGKIHPRPHDNQLAYIGGDTKIISIDRDAKFDDVVARLSAQWSTNVSFKYQLPDEDLDALISVTNDEDLEHLMMEYDRLSRGSASKPARLRLFLFPVDSAPTLPSAPSPGAESKPDQKWFVDALNSAPVQGLNRSTGSADSPDFLFNMEKGPAGRPRDEIPVPDSTPAVANPPLLDSRDYLHQPTVIPAAKRDQRSSPEPTMPTVVSGMHPAELQRQIHEFQRMQIANQEHQAAAMFQRKQEESLGRNLPSAPAYPPREGPSGGAAIASQGDYYGRVQEKNRYDPAPPAPQQASAPPVGSGYWAPSMPDRQAPAPEHPVYILQQQPPATAGLYPTNSNRPQGYFAVPPKMMAQPQPHPATAGFVVDPYGMGPAAAKMGSVPQPYPEGPPRQGIDPPPAFSHVVYDSSGGARAVYYTPAPGAAPSAYHAMGVDLRQPQPPPNQPSQDGGRSRPSSQG
ncbi:hypothetical protein EJ110_NYTH56516 [Nymphaea thermarum]|nr:hypothetical protein EJ110_NYTH56516 [Nymphaea thermarum]